MGSKRHGSLEHARVVAEAVARRSYGKLVALLATQTHDVEAAEDALAEALSSALTQWPTQGPPSNPEGWLLATARRKAIDSIRRRQTAAKAAPYLALLAEELAAASAPGTEIPDHRLALMFACAHPAIEVGVRAPLILQAVLGLTAKQIAAAFLTSPGTMGQRLTRAKTKIQRAGIPFRLPDREELPGRLRDVLDAIYAVFSEGWGSSDPAETAGRSLAEEATWLGRLVVELLPDSAEANGLLALMLYVEARRSARRDHRGDYVPLSEQAPARWDPALIAEAEMLLLRAGKLQALGRYQLEAALQSAHVHRQQTGTANWGAVVRLYDALLEVTGSPIVAVNRALAVAERQGAPAGLEALERITDARLAQYQPYWAARAELLVKTNRRAEARHAYDVAVGLERDPAVRRFLQTRRRALDG